MCDFKFHEIGHRTVSKMVMILPIVVVQSVNFLPLSN